MINIQRTPGKEVSTKVGILYMAFELSQSKWKLALSNGSKIRTVKVTSTVRPSSIVTVSLFATMLLRSLLKWHVYLQDITII